MKRLLVIIAIAALSDPVRGQSSARVPAAAFDIAGIEVSTRPNPGMRGGNLRGTRYELRNATMVDLIRTAYDVQPERITGGPSWLEWNRFDIAALAPEGTPPARLREMLRTLLADRFKLVVRESVTTTTASSLKAKSAHKLREVPNPAGCQAQAAPEPNGVMAQTVTCLGLTMGQLADQLARANSGYFAAGQQLFDETGLTGFYEFQFKYTPQPLLAQAGAGGIPLPAALERLGLALESKDIDVPAIRVETVTAAFTPNAPDLAKRLPPATPRFEVAVVKPTSPGEQPSRSQLLPSGQVNISGVALQRIMILAWELPDDRFIVGPGWLERARFDITARAFATPSPASNAQLDNDLIRMMLRALITERFQVEYHIEDRPMPAFTIVADKPKLAKADPSKRTRCYDGPPPGSTALPPPGGRLVTCQNISMDQFGQLLPSIAPLYTRVAALDKTGLQGGYDFTIGYNAPQDVQGRPPEAGASNAGVALDPTGAISLPDALRRQLGLRLEETRRPVPVLVIDSISEKPLDN